MQNLTSPIPSRIARLLHASFISLYVLLIIRAAVALHEGPLDPFHLPRNSLPILTIKRIAGIVYHPFFAVLLIPSPEGNSDLFLTILFAILGYALIHYGTFLKISVEECRSMADKILKLCRAVFFLGGTLLLLMIIARMGVMLYQDVVIGRARIGISVPAQK
jgi:hypothetical protein